MAEIEEMRTEMPPPPQLRDTEPANIRQWLDAVCAFLKMPLTKVARQSGLAPSTLNKFRNNPDVDYCLSADSINRIQRLLSAFAVDNTDRSLDGPAGVDQPTYADLQSKLTALPFAHNYKPSALRVIGRLEANVWVDQIERPAKHHYIAPMWLRSIKNADKVFGYEVGGGNMSDVYPAGSILAVLPIRYLKRPLSHGERVIIVRTRDDGMTEGTARELREGDDGQKWFINRSPEPQYQQALKMTGAKDIVVLGVVLGSYQPEPEFR